MADRKLKTRKGLWLTKDNRLIMMEAVMNPTEYKIMNYFMMRAVNTGNLEGISIPVKEVREYANIKGTAYISILKKATKAIGQTLIHVENVNHPNEWNDIPLVAQMGCKSGMVTCDFNPWLGPYFMGELRSFTKGEYSQLVTCTSYATMRLYEVCNSWKRTTGMAYYDVDHWRKLLGATSKTYAVFSQFKKHVLSKAVDEVNEKTDIHVELEFVKEGRSVTHIRALISDNSRKVSEEIATAEISRISEGVTSKTKNKRQKSRYQNISAQIKSSSDKLDDLSMMEREVAERMMDNFNLSETLAIRYVQGFGIIYCQEQMEYTRKQKLTSNVRNIGGYLKKAIENDYAETHKASEKAKAQEEAEHADKARWNRTAAQGIIPDKNSGDDHSSESAGEDGAKMLREFGVTNEKYITRWANSYPKSFLQKTFNAMRENDSVHPSDVDYIDAALKYSYNMSH